MNSTSTQFVNSRRIGAYQPIHQLITWGENFRSSGNLDASTSALVEMYGSLNSQSEDNSRGTLVPANEYGQEANKCTDKVHRRLAQNREAARKSRLRKKAYVQQLESSRLKLMQLEQELERARQQSLFIGRGGLDTSNLGLSETVNAGIAAFEMEYGQWVEEQNKQICELRNAMNAQISDLELHSLVENGMSHYYKLFNMKATAAKADIFYVMSGMWKTSAERVFFWIGGFRPSKLLKVLLPQLDPLTDQQRFDVFSLNKACQQVEDALSIGLEKLQEAIFEAVVSAQVGEGSHIPQMASAMERLEDLVAFANQADNLRRGTLQQMSQLLTTRQAAQGLLALGEFLQRLRALSSLWATRPREPA